MLEELLLCDGVGNRVGTIRLNTVHDHLGLLGLEESVLVGEVGDESPGQPSQNDSGDTKNQEDPSPSFKSTLAFEERHSVAKDVAETAKYDRNEIESGQTLLNLSAFVPCRDDED